MFFWRIDNVCLFLSEFLVAKMVCCLLHLCLICFEKRDLIDNIIGVCVCLICLFVCRYTVVILTTPQGRLTTIVLFFAIVGIGFLGHICWIMIVSRSINNKKERESGEYSYNNKKGASKESSSLLNRKNKNKNKKKKSVNENDIDTDSGGDNDNDNDNDNDVDGRNNLFSSWHYDGDSNKHSLASARAHNITMSPDNTQHVKTTYT